MNHSSGINNKIVINCSLAHTHIIFISLSLIQNYISLKKKLSHIVDTRNVEDIFIRDLVLKTYPICASEIWFGLLGASKHQSYEKAIFC